MVNTVHPEREAVEGKTSVEQLITDNIDVWTSAIKKRGSQGRGSSKKIELYGIKKLRKLILDLAMRGLLVSQNSNDGPASILLEKINSEKEQLIKDGEIKKPKSLPPIAREELFDLPSEWECVRLGEISRLMSGKGFKKSEYSDSGARLFQIANVSLGYTKWDVENFMPLSYCDEYPELKLLDGDVLIALNRPLLNKEMKVCILSKMDLPAILYQRVGKFDFYGKTIDTKFFYYYMQSGFFIDHLHENLQGSDQPFINQSQLVNFLFPLPSYKEQNRIVAKVDELMALCDQLEQQTESSLTAHQTLVETLLNTLLTAAQKTGTKESNSQSNSNQESSFDQAWNRIAQHFDVLFTTEHSIDQLKQTILQLAVMGKLVPQDPNDEPASVLLEKIAAEKEQLIKDKKIKKQKPLPPISDDEKPFELPSGWEWCRWAFIAEKIGDIDHKMPQEKSSGIPYVSPRDFYHNNIIDFKNAKKIGVEDFERLAQKIQPKRGDIIFPRYGTIGANVLVETDINFLASYSCCVIKTMNEFIEARYQFYYSISGVVTYQCRKAENKTTQANVGIKSIQEFLVPLPPLSEQTYIVAKVDDLMALCDTLKERIRESQTTQLHLADAMAEQALN